MTDDFENVFRVAFADPEAEPCSPCSALHLLGRTAHRLLTPGRDATDLWDAGLAVLAGIDHLARLRYGDAASRGWRFRQALASDLAST